jgi:competence protein ComEC
LKLVRFKVLLRIGIIPLSIALVSIPFIWSSSTSSSSFSTHFIDVGQGDSILLRDDTGFDILVDGGKTSAGPTVVAYLRDQSVDDIDVMIASHADADHIGGLIDVLNAGDIPVQAVLYNGYPGTTQTWLDFQTAVTNAGLALSPIQFPAEYTWGSMDVYVLNPPSGLTDPDQNDASVVLRIAFTDIDFMLTGDIDSTIEANVIARGTPIASEILKVPHHGSSYSSSTEFLTAVDPEVAVIQVGTNSYGHPAQDTISRLISAGAEVFRTDLDGTIVIQSDGVIYEVIPSIYRLYLPLVLKDTGSPPPTDTPEPPEPEVQITLIFYEGLEPT